MDRNRRGTTGSRYVSPGGVRNLQRGNIDRNHSGEGRLPSGRRVNSTSQATSNDESESVNDPREGRLYQRGSIRRNCFERNPHNRRGSIGGRSRSSVTSHNDAGRGGGRAGNVQQNNLQKRSLYRTESNPRLHDNSNGGQNDRFRGRSRQNRMAFKMAQEIGDNNNAEEVIQELLNDRKGFKELLKENELSGDWLILITKMITKICDTSFIESKIKIFQTVFVHSTYPKQLTSFISNLPNHDEREKKRNRYFWNESDQFWNNLIIIFEDVVKLPSFASQNLPLLLKAINRTLPGIEEEHNLHIADEIKEKFVMLLAKVQSMESEFVKRCEERHSCHNEYNDEEDYVDPPNDFREINVYPNIDEVTVNETPFLRKNKAKGAYKGIYHYLDVQFRLLREDFIAPFRNGICQYLNNPEQRRFDDVKIYNKVHFLSNESVNELNCIRIKYDFSNKKKNFKFENSKLFMYGSLVCFSKDHFKSVIFGRIIKRDVELLKKGELVIGFDEMKDIVFNTDYIMIESSVYFEPYFHVLTALQRMSLDDFPMEKYIIHAEKVAKPPKYLNETVSYDVDGAKLYPLFWPDGASHYGLNDSQQAAFRAALTQEIAVIQGPPGTGKTFIGLKIAQTLLKNRTIWHERGPILVICYTNHALDQFLEGIMPFTKDLLRIGGRSKNENLNKYNLRNSKVQRKSEAFYQIYRELKICLGKLKSIDNEFENILNYDGIIDFSSFDVLPHYRNSPFRHIAKEDITSWLLAEVNGDGEETDTMLPTLNVALPMVPKSSKTDSDDEINSEFDDREQEADIIEIEGDVANLVPLITLREIQLKIYQLKCKLEEFIQTPLGVIRESLEGDNIRERLFQLYQTYDYLQMRLRNLNKYRHCSNPDMDPRLMNPDDRWALYSMWLQQYLQYLGRKRKQLNNIYKEKYKIYSEQRDIEDVKIMRENLVVGMTTTGAARLRASLEALRSPIVIVEEAAEVLESHIVTALTVRCQHLILIGDHKQLKPSTANYKIATQYGLEVSLFERMVNNDLQCYTLDVQHRMKPKICNLIRPTIYPHLLDHTSVMRRPSIQGVVPDLFFIDHKYPEELCDNSSKKNIHEAKYLINLAKYLILNGYESDNITILAAYLGQMFEMQRERKKNDMLLANVRIAVLDNYQGEESDIILLSLVRNNSDNKIGFLKIENRVCVALSRARNGLYIMGNMDMLCNNSSLWRDVKKTLEAENALGKSLELRCSIHDTITEVECEDDFAKVPEGGCTLKCGTELSCGHICNNVCHIQDRDHNIYKCYEHCGRRLCDKTETHICKKKCFEECGPCDYPVTHMLPCGHEATIPCHIDPLDHKCSTLVSTTLECNHVANRPCYIPTEDFPCPHPCDNRVEQCGHACTRLCHVKDDPDHLQYKCQKPCVKSRLGCTSLKEPHVCRRRCFEECEPCTVDVKKKRTLCPHVYKVPCNSNVDEIVCEKPCKTLLPCNHICKKKCFETCGPCSIKVEKNIPACGHKTKLSCFETPERKHCNKQCNQTLPCGHGCTNKCSQPCTAKCLHMKDCDLMSPCGHNVKKISCYENCNNYDLILLKYCTAPCGVKLKCDHICKGTCGACFQGRIHQRCGEKCGVYLVCNHECPIPCREACKPCEKNCTYRCDHSVCKKKCGEICVKCAEQCPRKCVHQACKKKCGDICSVGPCEEPCPKSLQCGHPCIGFCNDRCPRKCRICDNDEVSEIFFGTEDDEDARFVELQGCKHILESTGMENWLNQGDEIQMKVCPKCKASVVNTQRYSDYVKRAIIDINNIKQRLIGSHKQHEERRERLLEQVAFIQEKSNKLLGMTHLRNSIKKIEGRLQSSKQVSLKSGKSNRVKQPIDGIVLQALTSKIQLLRYLLDVCCMPENIFMSPEMKAQITFILDTLVRDEDQITVQEIEDIELEINRLRRIVEIHPRLLPKYATDTDNKIKEEIMQLLFGYKRYTTVVDKELKRMVKQLPTRILVSDEERREIVKALGLTKGRWYKCPNGHPYVITECGGATQEATCPECGERIGGSNHRVLSTNQFAPEIDGAQRPLWSNAANMAFLNL